MRKHANLVEQFEQAFTQYLGASYAVAFSSGPAAMHGALYAAGISHKDEVILSSLDHPASAHAIRYLDGVPIYTDINPLTGCLDPEMVKVRLSANTRAVIATHYSGYPCALDELNKVLEGRDLVLIENASQALGAEYRGRKIGTISPLTVFDFSYPQGLYTELGGMVVTNSPEYHHWLKLFRDGGMMYQRDQFVLDEGDWYFEAQEIGFFYALTGMQAEMGLKAITELTALSRQRETNAGLYRQLLSGIDGLILPLVEEGVKPAWYSFPVLLQGDKSIGARRYIVETLRKSGLKADVQYYPIYQHPIYLWQGHPDVCTIEGPLCPRTEDYYRRVINLPVLGEKTELDITEAARMLKKLVAEVQQKEIRDFSPINKWTSAPGS